MGWNPLEIAWLAVEGAFLAKTVSCLGGLKPGVTPTGLAFGTVAGARVGLGLGESARMIGLNPLSVWRFFSVVGTNTG